MDIYTSRYRYSGSDRLDITVKGQDGFGKLFAPTWNMVMGVKNGTMSTLQYSKLYKEILEGIPLEVFSELEKRNSITLVCFCAAHTFCHRYLLANHLVEKGIGNFCGEH